MRSERGNTEEKMKVQGKYGGEHERGIYRGRENCGRGSWGWGARIIQNQHYQERSNESGGALRTSR